jgi:hypothetical protein
MGRLAVVEPDITPEIEIAWARAVARAFDDPAYYRSLKADPAKALSDLGADVSGIDVKNAIKRDGGLNPPLDALDDSIGALERKRSEVAAAGRPTYQAPGVASYPTTQSGTTSYGTPHPTTVHVHVNPAATYALSVMSKCTSAMYLPPTCAQPQGYWGPGLPPGVPCIALSQVATTRASATRALAPPQWIGGPPSGPVSSE